MSDVLVLNNDGKPLSTIPLSTISWKYAIKLVYTERATVIKYYEDWTVHSINTALKVPSVIMIKEFNSSARKVFYCRDHVYLRDEFSCQYCGSRPSLSDLTLDHVLPKSLGGTTAWENITTSCRDCNNKKGNNPKIKPKVTPYAPTYYQLQAKQKVLPIRQKIKDVYWKNFI